MSRKPTAEEITVAKTVALQIALEPLRAHMVGPSHYSEFVVDQIGKLATELERRLAKLTDPAALGQRAESAPSARSEPHPANDGAKRERAESFAKWFRTLLPAEMRLAEGWAAAWAQCYDQMTRLDGRTPEQIRDVCQWARRDEFWRKNFLSPLKLRQRDSGQVMYFDRFLAKMSTGRPSGAAAGQYEEPKEALPQE